MIHEEIVKALSYLYPEAKYVLSGEDIENIDWQSTNIQKPDLATLEKAYADSLESDKKAKELAAIRKTALLERLGITEDEAKLLLS
jgi:hypothetical protein